MTRPTNTQFAVAVHLLTLLASDVDELQSSEAMAASVGSNPVHMRRVLGRLRGVGIVRSRPGPHGGWQLIRDPAELRLGEIWRALDDAGHVLGLHAADPNCPVGRQVQVALAAVDRGAAAALAAELDGTTIADVVAQAHAPTAVAS